MIVTLIFGHLKHMIQKKKFSVHASCTKLSKFRHEEFEQAIGFVESWGARSWLDSYFMWN